MISKFITKTMFLIFMLMFSNKVIADGHGTITDWFFDKFFKRLTVFCLSGAVIPAAGSSISNKLGFCANNIPISSHCFCI